MARRLVMRETRFCSEGEVEAGAGGGDKPRGLEGRHQRRSNNGMQQSADTPAFVFSEGAARPLMPGVRLLMCYNPLLIECAAAAGGEAA